MTRVTLIWWGSTHNSTTRSDHERNSQTGTAGRRGGRRGGTGADGLPPEPQRLRRWRRRRAGAGGFIDSGTADGDKVVTILGAFGGDEEKNFNASLADFEKSSGIKIKYTSDQDFTTTIKQKVGAGDSPDIGLFPQPGGMLEFAAQKKVWPVDTYLDYDKLQSTLLPGFLDAGRYKGRVYGAPMRNAVKSIVWYPKAAYEKGGYNTAPEAIQQLQTDVADKIAGQRHHPVVHRLGVRPGHRLGRHRLGRGAHAAHVGPRRLRPVDLAPHPLQRPARRQGPRRGRQVQQGPEDGPRRHQGRAQHRSSATR